MRLLQRSCECFQGDVCFRACIILQCQRKSKAALNKMSRALYIMMFHWNSGEEVMLGRSKASLCQSSLGSQCNTHTTTTQWLESFPTARFIISSQVGVLTFLRKALPFFVALPVIFLFVKYSHKDVLHSYWRTERRTVIDGETVWSRSRWNVTPLRKVTWTKKGP